MDKKVGGCSYNVFILGLWLIMITSLPWGLLLIPVIALAEGLHSKNEGRFG